MAGLTQADIPEAMETTPMYRAVFNPYAIEEYGHREIASNSAYPRERRNPITRRRAATCGSGFGKVEDEVSDEQEKQRKSRWGL